MGFEGLNLRAEQVLSPFVPSSAPNELADILENCFSFYLPLWILFTIYLALRCSRILGILWKPDLLGDLLLKKDQHNSSPLVR